MHLSEGILPAAQAALWAAVATPFVAASAATLKKRSLAAAPAEKALLSTGTALLFAATLLPIPVPVAGATSHLCVTPLLGLVLGPWTVAAPAAFVLLLQALFFGHGGLTTLGANSLTLGVVGPFVAAGLWWLLRRCRVSAPLAAGVACGVGQLSVYVADAGILGAALSGEKSFGFWAVRVLAGFAPVQLPLAVLEGVLSAVLLGALARRRPELAPAACRGGVRTASVTALLAVALLASPAALAKEPLRGLDEAVFDETARAAGRAPRPPVVDLGEEVHTALLLAAGFCAGWVTSRGFATLRHDPRSLAESAGEPSAP